MIAIGRINGDDLDESLAYVKAESMTPNEAMRILDTRIARREIYHWVDLVAEASDREGGKQTQALLLAAIIPLFAAMEISHNRTKAKIINAAIISGIALTVIVVIGTIIYFTVLPVSG